MEDMLQRVYDKLIMVMREFLTNPDRAMCVGRVGETVFLLARGDAGQDVLAGALRYGDAHKDTMTKIDQSEEFRRPTIQ